MPGSPRQRPQHGSPGWATGLTSQLHLAPPTILNPALGPRVLGGLLGGMWSCFRLPVGSSSQTGLDSPHQQLGEVSPIAQSCQATKANRTPPTLTNTRPPHPTHTPREPGRAGLASWAETARLPPPHPSRPSTTPSKCLSQPDLCPLVLMQVFSNRCGTQKACRPSQEPAPGASPRGRVLEDRMFHASTLNPPISSPLDFQDNPNLDGVGRESRQATSDTRRLGEPSPAAQPTLPEPMTRQMTNSRTRFLQSFIRNVWGQPKGPLLPGQHEAYTEDNS